MTRIEFFVPGPPQPLKRHRTFRRGEQNINMDPSAQAKDNFLLQAMVHRPAEPFRHPLMLDLKFLFPRPKTHFRANGKVKPMAPNRHISRPDLDNLQKFVLDALNGVFWHDDACVCLVTAEKAYGDSPGVSVLIQSATEA
jgi:Holliday junction resolvase RusA-like endonuclease